jgi:hypothetical protein
MDVEAKDGKEGWGKGMGERDGSMDVEAKDGGEGWGKGLVEECSNGVVSHTVGWVFVRT